MLLFYGYIIQTQKRYYQRTNKALPQPGLDVFLPITLRFENRKWEQKLKRLSNKIACCRTEGICLLVQCQKFELPFIYDGHLCFFIYSCNALSNSSLILRVEPVLFTTNLIHSVHVCLSIFIEVFVFCLPSGISFTLPYAVNKVNGYYHNINILAYGIIVWRYGGNNISLLVSCSSSEDSQVESR